MLGPWPGSEHRVNHTYRLSLHGVCSEDAVLCPVCKARWMLLSPDGHVLLCACGLRLDLEDDAMTKEYVKGQLALSFDEHREHCPADLVFQKQDHFGISTLCAQCAQCQFWRVVI